MRAEGLTTQHIKNPNNFESLYNKITGVELLLRQRNISYEQKQHAVRTMEDAKAMAEHLFGPLSLITAQTNLKLALALCLDPCRKQEGLDLLESVE